MMSGIWVGNDVSRDLLIWQAAEADMQSDLTAERIKRECAERRLFAAIRRCAEIADHNWEIEAKIRAEFPKAFEKG